MILSAGCIGLIECAVSGVTSEVTGGSMSKLRSMMGTWGKALGCRSLISRARAWRARRKWWQVAWLAMVPVELIRAGTLAETDTFWQVRAGLLTLDEGTIPSTDPFSWTVHGQAWTLNSWGFNVLVAGAYRLGELPGVALACAALSAVAFGLVLVLARRLGASAGVAGTLLLLTSPLLIAWLSARPQLVDYIAVLALVFLLHRLVSGEATAWVLPAIGLLTIVWVNLHAGALLGVAMIAAATVLVFFRSSTRRRGPWCLGALVIAGACALVNPYGVHLLDQTMHVQSSSAGVVAEWQPINPADPVQMTMLILGLIALAVAARRNDVVFTAAIGVAVVASGTAIRILPILLLLALPVLASFASHRVVLQYLHNRRVVFLPGAVAVVAVLVVMAVMSLGHVGRPDPAQYSSAVVQAIPQNCKVFNSYSLGGFIMLQRPDVQVSLDSRNDLYGSHQVLASKQVLDGIGDLNQELTGADCVLVPPASGLAQSLTSNQAWDLRAADTAAELFIRR
jgi:hypothetical protein